MMRYYCNCCGCDFSESEGTRYYSEGCGVSCPKCGECYFEDDKTCVEKYDEETDVVEMFKKSVDVQILDNTNNIDTFNAIIDSRRGIVIK